MRQPIRRQLLDRRPGQRSFTQARKAERWYAGQLNKIARQIGDLVNGTFDPNNPLFHSLLTDRLRKYADIITPWAERVGARMIADVARNERQVWEARSAEMGRLLHKEIDTAPTGVAMRQKLAEQVKLIRSLPIEAAERVHRLTVEGIAKGQRAEVLADEIMKTGDVTRSRAMLIARTEVGRTATALTQARAEYAGSTGYIWKTSGDSDVRPSHAAMAGKFVSWNEPPTLDGMTGHAGALPNCRCWTDPVLRD